jgi:NAD(P)-dependent dehydrogenase (short-subunit alcohol dehydrogenase family)
MMATDFAGKSVVVTGAASGMGRAIAAAFAAAGASVTAADINVAGGEETVAAITAAGGVAQFVPTDVADAAAVEALIAQAVAAYGDLHCAVNAAAIEGESVPLDQLDDDLFDRVQRINVRSVFLCMKHELKAMMAAGTGGAIVNIASTNSYRPQPRQSAYTTSKFAVLGMTKSAAIDYAQHGIRINAICPGSIDTPMLRNAMARRKNGDEAATIARLSLIGRFGLVDEIAKAALWLCSDDSSFTMGHALAVDGGYLAR